MGERWDAERCRLTLSFHPDAGAIVICDFTTGFRPPEMVKKRPAVIISPRRRGAALVTVVPLSTTPPDPVEPWHWPVPPGLYPRASSFMWAKADVVMTVAFHRLDRVRAQTRRKVVYVTPTLNEIQLDQLRAAVRVALGMS